MSPEQAVSRLSHAEPLGPGKPEGFSKEEVSQILHERNELKANLFLLREELNYYHRWVAGQGQLGCIPQLSSFHTPSLLCCLLLGPQFSLCLPCLLQLYSSLPKPRPSRPGGTIVANVTHQKSTVGGSHNLSLPP